jgi:hypothetical protein
MNIMGGFVTDTANRVIEKALKNQISQFQGYLFFEA